MKKDQRFGLTLTSDDRRLLEILSCSDDDMPMAAYLRRLIRREAREHGLLPSDPLPGTSTPNTAELQQQAAQHGR